MNRLCAPVFLQGQGSLDSLREKRENTFAPQPGWGNRRAVCNWNGSPLAEIRFAGA